ncbi:DUF998 domain-containing protein [Nocardioides pantholopis]|uniref:DUF998 domain-containing protein n=1 Tax=Nocardioides pantholopis TaxID=2483798 RepID=UPI000FD8F394|nr:DUF998 domain-containing protein [Nocardioides pantholopis]
MTGNLTGPWWRSPAVPAALGVGAGTLYANFVVDWARRGSASLGHVVSELAAPGEPQAWIYRAGEVGCAALVLPLLPTARAGLPAGLGREVVAVATAVFAAGAAAAAVVPTPCGPGVVREEVDRRPRSNLHDGASIVSDVALYLGVAAAWATTRRRGPGWFHRAAGWVLWLGTGSNLAAGYARPVAGRRWLGGVSQRVNILTISAWLCCLGLIGAQAVRDRSAPPREAGLSPATPAPFPAAPTP